MQSKTLSKRVLKQRRKRKLLLSKAREMVLEGEKLRIATVARRAGLSIATAYRLFSDPEELRRAAMSDDSGLPDSEEILNFYREAVGQESDAVIRLLIAQRVFADVSLAHEGAFRFAIAAVHEQGAVSGRKRPPNMIDSRVDSVLEDALAPLKKKVSPSDFSELVLRLRLVVGPEPFFTLKDRFSGSITDIISRNHASIRAIYRSYMEAAGAA